MEDAGWPRKEERRALPTQGEERSRRGDAGRPRQAMGGFEIGS
jgi:hypothetical protein